MHPFPSVPIRGAPKFVLKDALLSWTRGACERYVFSSSLGTLLSTRTLAPLRSVRSTL